MLRRLIKQIIEQLADHMALGSHKDEWRTKRGDTERAQIRRQVLVVEERDIAAMAARR